MFLKFGDGAIGWGGQRDAGAMNACLSYLFEKQSPQESFAIAADENVSVGGYGYSLWHISLAGRYTVEA